MKASRAVQKNLPIKLAKIQMLQAKADASKPRNIKQSKELAYQRLRLKGPRPNSKRGLTES